VPKVAELPTFQYTLQAEAPFIIATEEPLAVVSVLPILKTNNASAVFSASSVRVPVNWADDEKQYTPGVSVRPPRSVPVRS
jgi:hypothetical protein